MSNDRNDPANRDVPAEAERRSARTTPTGQEIHNPPISIMPQEYVEGGVGPHFPSGVSAVEAAAAGALDISGNPVEVTEAQLHGGVNTPAEAEEAGERAALKRGEKSDADDDFDPGDNNVDDVLSYVDKNPDQKAKVLKAEKAGKNRTTLVNQLEAR